MIIRKAGEDETPRLMELSTQFEYSPFSFDKRVRQLAGEIYPAFAETMLKDRQFLTLVAEDNGFVAGYVTAAVNKGLTQATGTTVGNILLLSVDKAYRGKGVGTALVEKATAYLCANGASIVTVVTDLYNIPAISVYEECGYRMRMGWHIYRYYREFGIDESAMSDAVELLPLRAIERFRGGFSRPVSLVKDRGIDGGALREYLAGQFLSNIRKGKTMPLGLFRDGEAVAMLNLAEDEISVKTLSSKDRKVVVYKLLDLIAAEGTDVREAGAVLLRDATARLRDFDILELWIDAENDAAIEAAERAGYHLSYTGVVLHYTRKFS